MPEEKWWDKAGLNMPREKTLRWRIVNYGQADERAECENCGNGIHKSVYMYRHSLPLICPNCKELMQGFVSGNEG